jgi:hypothetical protein
MPIQLNGDTGIVFPIWTTAGRPGSPQAGQTGYNSTLKIFEMYNGTSWIAVGPETGKSIAMAVVFGG